MLRLLSVLLTLGGAALVWFIRVDRTSPIALDVIEQTGGLPVPVDTLSVAVGVLLGVIAAQKGKRRSVPVASPTGRRSTRPEPLRLVPGGAADPIGGVDRAAILARARALPLEEGARLVIDEPQTVPFTLVLEQAPPERARRAIGTLALFVQSIPRPPRVAIRFVDCPMGGSPRHHQVAGAMSTHVPRSAFRAVAHLDQVDLLFYDSAPDWDAAWRNAP